MDNNNEFIVKPNAIKEFLKNLTTIFIIVLIIIFVLIFLYLQVSLDFIPEILQSFDIQITLTQLFLGVSGIFITGATLLLLFNYMNIKNLKYTVHNDNIEYSEITALVFLNKESVPFHNITRITFSNKGFMNKLLNCGDIKIDVSGLKISNMVLPSIDFPEKLTQVIQQKVNEYNMQKQMQYQEDKKVKGILDKF